MSKVTVTPVSNIGGNPTSAATTLNSNDEVLAAAFDNTLSRDGTAPNQMGADLDMNSNHIINLPEPLQADEAVRLIDLNTATLSAAFTVGVGLIYLGADSKVLYDNNGVLGEYDITGTGSVVMSASPVINTPDINGGTIDNAAIGQTTPAAGNFTTIAVGSTLGANRGIGHFGGNIDGPSISRVLFADPTVSGSVNYNFQTFTSFPSLASNQTCNSFAHFNAQGFTTYGTGINLATEVAYTIGPQFGGHATTSRAYYSPLDANAGGTCWNLYFDGTARSYMAGGLSIGGTTDPGTGGLYVKGATTLDSTLTVNGTISGTAVGTAANNIVQLDANGKLPAVDGSQLTNLSGVLPGYVTPENFNAAGDGVTNDTTALASAFTAAQGQTLLLTGTYLTDPFMIGGTNCPARIISVGAIIKQRSGTAALITIENPHSGVDYKGLILDGRLRLNANNLGANGLRVHGLQDSNGYKADLSGITIENATGVGMSFVGEPGFGIYGVSSRNCVVINCGAQGMAFQSINNTGQYYVQADLIENAKVSSCVGGLYMDYAGAVFVNPWMEGNTGAGLDLFHTQGVVVVGGHFEANTIGATDTSIQGTVGSSTGVKLVYPRTTGSVTNLSGGSGNALLLANTGYEVAGVTDAPNFDYVRTQGVSLGTSSKIASTINSDTSVALAVDGNSQLVVDGDPASGNTSLRLTYNNGTVQRVKPVFLGAVDSGGTGFRTLIVTN